MPGDVRAARVLARATDTLFRIPGTGIRFGIDALIGLVPGFGDASGVLLSGYVVAVAAWRGVPVVSLVRMLGNIGIEAVLGLVPAVGDLFDVGWKANVKNVALLDDHLAAPDRARRASLVRVGGVVVAVLGLVAATVWASLRILFWVLGAV